MPSDRRQTRFADYLDVFKALNLDPGKAIVVGGQAVNFWAERFEEDEPELRNYGPFTSTDLDLHRLELTTSKALRSQAIATEPQRDPFGKAFTIVGETFFMKDKGGETLTIDALKLVTGLRPDEVEKGALKIESRGVSVLILTPIACLKAKMFNVQTIDQRNRHDEKHVRILFLCVRAFLRQLLREGETSTNYRPVLKALNQVTEMTAQRDFRKTAQKLKLDLNQLLPSSELRASDDPKIQNFVTKLLPQWQKRVAEPTS